MKADTAYPACRFRCDGIVDSLAAILEAMPLRSDWMRLEWFLVADDGLNGIDPLEALKEGGLRDVIDIARGYGAE